MDSKLKLLISQLGENRVKIDSDISEHLHTGLGAVAEAFYIATTVKELIKVVDLCRELKLNFMIVGAGSKVALSEKGFTGLVIKNRSDALKIFGIKGKVSRAGIGIEEAFIEADSGTSLSRISDFAHVQMLGGFETLKMGIGTIGGSLMVNPVLREKTSQIKVLTKTGSQKAKQLKDITREDIILSIIFKLKAR